ncbi:hypothetical protein P3C24_21565 [Pseudomonas proteolytica]|uniref:hypothetical protein n=1 Tax=Pseudomonas proteolytica TaxID=219574 RepID=UPI0023DFD87F|nr:hypothetical protein [Pseudomonas proteolytica]MDF3163536.1 hypothetical protein [Pseudomonas proteolytica]
MGGMADEVADFDLVETVCLLLSGIVFTTLTISSIKQGSLGANLKFAYRQFVSQACPQPVIGFF